MLLSAKLVSICARRFLPRKWSFLGPGPDKKWYSAHEYKPQGECEGVGGVQGALTLFSGGVAQTCHRVVELKEQLVVEEVDGEGQEGKVKEEGRDRVKENARHPVFRSTSPLSRGTLKSKGGGKLSIHFCADGDPIETVFRTIISVNQLSTFGAVAEMCEEYESCHVRSGRPVLAGQSDPLFVPRSSLMKTPTALTDDPAQGDLLQKYQERALRLSQQDRVIKYCTDAGFLTTVDVGQYFMTKDTEEFPQFTDSVACREYTLPRDEIIIQTKRLDSREHQNWARVGSHNQLLANNLLAQYQSTFFLRWVQFL